LRYQACHERVSECESAGNAHQPHTIVPRMLLMPYVRRHPLLPDRS
jgi:hypothetical protein